MPEQGETIYKYSIPLLIDINNCTARGNGQWHDTYCASPLKSSSPFCWYFRHLRQIFIPLFLLYAKYKSLPVFMLEYLKSLFIFTDVTAQNIPNNQRKSVLLHVNYCITNGWVRWCSDQHHPLLTVPHQYKTKKYDRVTHYGAKVLKGQKARKWFPIEVLCQAIQKAIWR